ncbi:MAG: T9SS type A sorting domain-containing protein [Muribaculaceae bacterium]|nr:T9SS type A sorting domain-containing protein [Muribaculaceae bacterium]
MYKGSHKSTGFKSERQRAVDSAVAKMEAGKPSRFVNALEATASDGSYNPDQVFEVKDLYGDIDGPDGKLWFYYGNIEYEYIVHNEHYTEALPQSFEVNIYDNEMKLRGTVKDKFELKADEARVRVVDVLPVITKNYFNSDDKYELAVSVIVNPKPFGVRPYTYVYSLGGEKDAQGDNVPVSVINGMINEVLDASTPEKENVIMTFIHEYNDSGVSEDDLYGTDETARQNFWKYQLGNKIGIKSYGAADASGKLTEVFSKTTVYYQANGNQQDDPLSLLMVHNGKPVIVFPYYEDIFYNPFYSSTEDFTQRLPNNLVIEIYEQSTPGEPFTLKQTSKIPVVKSSESDVLFSYYSLGGFRYRDDVAFDGDIANFIITRRDYIPGKDSERMSFFAYNSDGSLKRTLFENSQSHASLSNLKGFDPMELFIGSDGTDYIFNFVNLRTFETELSLNYGLMLDGPDGEPDYIMANLERTLTADGKSFMYVAEMRQPGYDDINDISYMRVVWLNRDGSFDHIDQINMGERIKYAKLFLDGPVLQPDFFHSDAKQEYMLLIKRDMPAGSAKDIVEELLVAQAADAENPAGKDLLLLGDCEAGSLLSIIPVYGERNRLAVTYGTQGSTRGTTHYYDLPLDVDYSGIENVAGPADDIHVVGTTVSAPGRIEVYNMQGVQVTSGNDSIDLAPLAKGVYVVRASAASVKVVVK